MKQEDVIVIGGGPCGLSAAIACQQEGLSALVIEKDNVVSAIYRYPTHQTFFSTSEKLEIADVPFVVEQRKPHRNQALVYYRDVVKRKQVRVHAYEKVEAVEKLKDGSFEVKTSKQTYATRYVVVATGYYDSPNLMNIPGEGKPHVFHYFKEAHPFFDHDVAVIGGKNSAVDAALELEKAGARVKCLYRGSDYSTSVKPWILPEFTSLVKNEKVEMIFGAEVDEIDDERVHYRVNGEAHTIRADFVFAMTGYHPDHRFLHSMGVGVNNGTGRPMFDRQTMETNVKGIFIAGVIAAGNNANEIFIENGRWHGEQIAKELAVRVEEEEQA
ncbi:YpdA family putative bacillithiol disulfide reductase [Shouchella shacheensis]|uniref:YpdA family putative bacillithiol disulfide reductase n=1 Tax=Shouchella shacheensis TaxID=1649580 RepID=UPI00074049AC|nr:YpdA family putative bacillithiol disulfide reductase [Shouchella shacheensis]